MQQKQINKKQQNVLRVAYKIVYDKGKKINGV